MMGTSVMTELIEFNRFLKNFNQYPGGRRKYDKRSEGVFIKPTALVNFLSQNSYARKYESASFF